jgi:glycosyltransferase involved in cell wall biosynthesis
MRAKEAKLKTAFIFYDAIPLLREEFAAIAPLHAEYMQQLLLADLVVPISNWSAKDIVSFFMHYEKSPLTAIPVVETLLLPGETHLTKKLARLAPATQKIILTVGTIERRKNQGTLLDAFDNFVAHHPNSEWKLILVGNLHANMSAEVNSAVARNKNIICRGNISDADLDELYSTCAFTVFPSVEEGFGLPIVESLDYGKPCICANFGAMAEVAVGGGCLTVDVHNAALLENAIARLASETDDTLIKLTKEAVARKSKTWADYTKDFRDLLDYADSPRNRLGKIFYWIDQTCIYPANTGIQRVVRCLARALQESGLELVPVKWDVNSKAFALPSSYELGVV